MQPVPTSTVTSVSIPAERDGQIEVAKLWVKRVLLHSLLLTSALVVGMTASNSHAQSCGGGRWLENWAAPGIIGTVHAVAVAPNGDLIAAGDFTMTAGVPTNRIARWNGLEWSPLGNGVNGPVRCLAFLPNGDLIAGGTFSIAGEVAASNIAKWDGTQWTGLGTGTDGAVNALAILPSGELVAGGYFNFAGGSIVRKLAIWRGSWWQGLGSELHSAYDSVMALTVMPNGDLIAAGSFSWGWGSRGRNIMRWDGTMWTSLGDWPVAGGGCGDIRALAVLPGGDLMVGGYFECSTFQNITRWDGARWLPVLGLSGGVRSLAVMHNGDVVASGHLQVPGSDWIARFDGATWSPMGSGMQQGLAESLAVLPNGDLVAGGDFSGAGGFSVRGIARWTTGLRIVSPPTDQAAIVDSPASFSVEVADQPGCTAALTYRWQRRNPAVADPSASGAWQDLSDDGTFANTDRATMTIRHPIPALSTGFRCRIGGGCGCASGGFIYTDSVNFSIACPADFNADGGVDFGDIEAFFERWENGC